MRQYLDAKQQHRDAILLFRMGDFYEMFYEDALVAARALELTLTSRSKDANGGGIPMCGVPFHAVDGYIARLVKKGFRVAICDQVEDPRKAKGLVKREVVRVVSPGTLTDAELPRRARAGVPDGGRASAGRALTAPRSRRRRSASRCSISRPASSPPPSIDGADGLQALADEIAVLKPREIVVPVRTTDLPAPIAADGDARSRRSTSGRSTANRRAATLLDSAPGGRPRRVRPRRHTAPRSRRPARSSTICGARRKSTSRTCAPSPTASAPTRCSSIRRRSSTSRSSKAPKAAAQGSLLDELDRTVTSIGSRLLRSWLLAAAGRARADSRSARRRRRAGVPDDRARQVPRRAQGRPGSRAAASPAPRSARRARAIWSA